MDLVQCAQSWKITLIFYFLMGILFIFLFFIKYLHILNAKLIPPEDMNLPLAIIILNLLEFKPKTFSNPSL